MKYPLPLRTVNSTVSETTLRTIQRAVAAIGQESRPRAFAHIHPHAHATAKLTRHFVTHYRRDSRSHTPTLEEIEFSAHMHDVGKYFIATSILLKPGRFDEDERAVMSLHPIYGAIIISKLPGISDLIKRVILYHHEHWDGSGYPDGLSGTSIPLEARIVAVVDVYTSLRSRRSYKPTLPKEEALKLLGQMAGQELDPYLTEDFIKLIRCWK
ncbi:MAG TPA: HD domain-containing phosphohydrolase [Pyrinomonadaceae bacterium]|jgi:putative two-component system response regulator|nr:HD domain-containing phosphohydrolase [Pyrinomonadaceae bacterium]